MWPETSGHAELDDAKRPGDDGWPGGEPDEADPDWPEDETREAGPGWPGDQAEDERDPDWPDDWGDDGGDDPPWRRAARPTAHGQGRGAGRPGLRPLALAIVAVVALAAGAGVALAIVKGLERSPSPSAASSSQPPAVAPGGGGGAIPGGGGAVGEMFVAGPVTAVSGTSITIGGPGHTVTAAITSATRITGKVTSIGAIKVGDQVSAQITQASGGQPTAAAIQDPAQAPSGGSLP
ncbi:MAG TPA: DUF5666 domain-containing protein [Streptosporangiaceae bacterium]|nr:DUF5666 domain-containing protein [Streptosporangiaceae bacterium]